MERRTLLQLPAAAAVPSPDRPNVLFLMTDQHRYDCLGANGNRLIRTPHLDRLAAQSANFSQAVVQSPVCVPSRISYFTGRYPHSHKNRVNYTPAAPGEVMMQGILREAGYQTAAVGKLHFHPPTPDHARATGFDRVLLHDGVPKTDPYSDYVRWRGEHDPAASVPYHAVAKDAAAGSNPFRGAVPDEFSPTTWTGMQSAALLTEMAASAKPFFLFASFFKPHSPHQIPAPWDSMYNDVDIPLPRRLTLGEIHKLPLPVQKQILRGTPQFGMDRDRLQWIYRSYYGAVSQIDREVGRILQALERSGKERNTLIIFATDHGDQLLEHGLEGKNVFFESSVRVPFLLRFPGARQSGRYDAPVEMVDVLPTVLDLCGIPVPKRVQGRSLADPSRVDREVAFAENIIPEVINSGSLDMPFIPGKGVGGIRHPDAKMARTRRWKLNYYPGHGGELYDLVNDPGEERNLYRDPGSQNTVRDLKGAMLDWLITADESDQIAERWLL